jgi:2-dehydro-3-deoxyphosphooctonate aldolase (KDO 8-P synthase)
MDQIDVSDRMVFAGYSLRFGTGLGTAGLFIEAHCDPGQAGCGGPCASPSAVLEDYRFQMGDADKLLYSAQPLVTG